MLFLVSPVGIFSPVTIFIKMSITWNFLTFLFWIVFQLFSPQLDKTSKLPQFKTLGILSVFLPRI